MENGSEVGRGNRGAGWKAEAQGRLARRLQNLLYSSRPSWAMMPGFVAENFGENLLFTLSALERAGVEYVAHYGTLLGAVRLGGMCPWDEDADIFLLGESRASVEEKVGETLRAHGFNLIWDPGGFYWVRQRPWWAGQGHIALEFLPDRPRTTDLAATDPSDPFIPEAELRPLRRYPFHGSWIWGPAQADAVLSRHYGASGTPKEMARHRAPVVSRDFKAFWGSARSDAPGVTPAWDDISHRIRRRQRRRPLSHLATFPWWWFNGGYNIGIGKLRALGDRLVRRSGGIASESRVASSGE